MSYPIHYYATIGGSAYSKAEFWQLGVRAIPTVEPGDDPAADFLAWPGDSEAALKSWFTDVNAKFPNTHKLEWCKIAAIGTDGKYLGPNTMAENLFDSAATGSATTNFHPGQCSFVITLTTAVARGQAAMGRVYLPTQTYAIESNGAISSGLQGDAIDTGLGLLDALAANMPGDLAVVSGVGDGLARPITGVRVGRVMDTQRRRRRSLPELYQEAEWPV
uniref:Uncharacterized protein n=1 Tax=uncultured prokaryote TaxID=198431 RepID=A0A0H5Q561_9ZZZZ|nr:hypothetical protein [uncultured prokaryote]